MEIFARRLAELKTLTPWHNVLTLGTYPGGRGRKGADGRSRKRPPATSRRAPPIQAAAPNGSAFVANSMQAAGPGRKRSFQTLTAAAAALHHGEATAAELAERCARQAARLAPLNAFVSSAFDAPAPAPSAGPAAAPSVLAGIPVAAKANFCVRGVESSAGSAILGGFRPHYSSTATARLEGAGARIVGMTRMDEFGMGNGTFFSEPPCHNPYSPEGRPLVPGGSSGGSAAAVAAHMCYGALGSDTGGSVRQPASFCGVVGLKPTYGLISRHGLIAYASSLDTVGVLTRSVADAAAMLDAIAGPCELDATCLHGAGRNAPRGGYLRNLYGLEGAEEDELFDAIVRSPSAAAIAAGGGQGATADAPLGGLVVGIPGEMHVAELDAAVEAAWRESAAALAALGAEVVAVSMPMLKLSLPCYAVLSTAEAASNLSRYDGVRYGPRAAGRGADGADGADGATGAQGGAGEAAREFHEMVTSTRSAFFGAEVKRRVLLGNYVLSEGAFAEYYLAAEEARRAVAADFRTCFEGGVDVLLAPTAPTTAFEAPRVGGGGAAPPYLDMLANDVMTLPASLAGLPAMSLPVAHAGGLPVGMQLIGAACEEAKLLRVGAALEGAVAFRGLAVP